MRATVRSFTRHPDMDGWYVVDVAGIDGEIHLPAHALADRMFGYALESEEDALDAIVREHVVRLGLVKDRAAHAHGLHPDVQVAHKAEAKAQRDDVIAEDAPLLQMHRARAGIAPRTEWTT